MHNCNRRFISRVVYIILLESFSPQLLGTDSAPIIQENLSSPAVMITYNQVTNRLDCFSLPYKNLLDGISFGQLFTNPKYTEQMSVPVEIAWLKMAKNKYFSTTCWSIKIFSSQLKFGKTKNKRSVPFKPKQSQDPCQQDTKIGQARVARTCGVRFIY